MTSVGDPTSFDTELTPFQHDSLQEIQALLGERGLRSVKKVVRGKKETFVVLVVESVEPALKIYVYDDEVGYFSGDSWQIWEHPPYSDLECLKQDFIAALTKTLESSLG